jgi:hypothetical protein
VRGREIGRSAEWIVGGDKGREDSVRRLVVSDVRIEPYLL